jgi:M6 family metalloprotease-like protein
VPLAAGAQVLRLVMDTVASSGAVGNFNWMRVQPDVSGSFAITGPTPGSTLRTTAFVLRWDGGGDEFWVNVGTTPGGADVYASGSIGQAAEHTVTGLPLNGTTVYVEVRRRIGGRVDAISAQYTSPVRKALAIVTDFSDRKLEDWTGAGMKSLADVSAQLRALEEHWAWLSRGREQIQWDIVRIRLPQAAVPGAYANWNAFRDAVALLAKQQVDIADYDVNGDAVLDVSWAIVCSGDAKIEYAIGGSSKNAGVNMFMDGQASQSVWEGQTGNFTHEVGHLLGIVDMYGDYATQGPLTIMSYPWVNPGSPPGDFGAYEQQLLGWLKPRVVNTTTHDVWLPNAFDQLAAVKVPTARDSEYFLIEYRRKPQTGYGSAHFNVLDGLVVYHVLEGSHMSQDPPLVKLEPADGRINPGAWPDPASDLIYPGNPSWTPPLVMYTYDRVPQEVFRLDNVAWVDGGMSFDLTVMPLQPALNLLANVSFESGDGGRPSSWMSGAYLDATQGFVWPGTAALRGVASAQIESSRPDDKHWRQSVDTVIGEQYKLCGWLKGERITGGSVGANVSVLGGYVRSYVRMGTFDWSQSCTTFSATASQVEVACRLGFYGDLAAGAMWCDEMTLEPFHPRSAF